MTTTITIRQEQPEDYIQVHELNILAFDQYYEAKLVEALRKNDQVFIPELSMVATKDNEVVGYILFTKILIADISNNTFESLSLAPIAILPQYQKKGIGTELIKQGLLKAREMGFTSVIVLGHEQFYPRFGFLPASKWNIKPPFDVPSNAFMALELMEDGLKNVSGIVQYPKEFEPAD